MLKKLNVGGYLNVLAALLGLAGTILTIVSGMVSADNPLANTALIAVAGFGGVALCLLAILAPSRWGNFDMVGSVSILGAIALYCYTFGAAVAQRVMLIAGLFSFNSANEGGWSVFYVSAAAWACLLLGCVLLVASGFVKSVKEG
mgnify:FL=1